jgi:murein DD-endopeptidase MepM/ murein hydrolase activator NlpD
VPIGRLASKRIWIAAGAGAFVCAAMPGSALSAAGPGGGGGAVYVAVPKISKVSCVRSCASRKRVRPGSTIAVTGSNLSGVTRLIFMGARGSADDVKVPVQPRSSYRLSAKVPMGAGSGPLTAYVSRAVRSRPSASVPILPPPPPAPNAELSPVPGAPSLETGTSRTKVFYGARNAVTFSYRVRDPAGVVVELVRASDGAVVKSWDQGQVPAGEERVITWNAKSAPGRYSFRLTAQGPSGDVAQSAETDAAGRDAFDLYDHVFPVRGKHDYGGAGAEFGAGRGGRSHQGQDVFARCGTRMVAARGGKVQYSGYHGAAGNYIVIDGAGTSTDYAYMHLTERSPFREGDRVYTGQQIGTVGESGNAHGCHLHFELWSAPGWYQGGHAFDPLPSLQSWDGWS